MPASTVYTGLGATLKRTGGTAIAYLTEIGGVSLKQASMRATNMDSPSDAEEYLGGLISAGSVPFKGFFKPGDAPQFALYTDLSLHTMQSWTVTYDVAAATTWIFTALVEEFTILGVTIENIIEFSASLKVSGLPALGVTASAGLSGLTGIDSVPGALVFLPVFGVGERLYSVAVVDEVTHIHLTPVAVDHTITITCLGVVHVVATGEQSEAITIGAKDTVTPVTIVVAEVAHAPVEYVVYVARAAS